jgi:hypothetical protein
MLKKLKSEMNSIKTKSFTQRSHRVANNEPITIQYSNSYMEANTTITSVTTQGKALATSALLP